MHYDEYKQRFEFDPDTAELGEGGFGRVFRAWDHERQEEVALKIAPVRPDQEAFSLQQEYELVKHLRHGNIAIYLDCQRLVFPGMGRHDVAWMKYYQAGHLGQLLAQHRLSAAQKEPLLLGVLAGIEYLHTRQPFIIHRDLKPANILIVERGGQFIPLITDFGISRQGLEGGHSHITNTVKALSLHFAAPEQGDADELRPSADLWSFGVLVAYVWGEGRLPFRDEGLNLHTEAGQRQLRERIHQLDVLPSVWAQVPEPWAAVLRACLVVDPTKRVKSAAQLRQLLAPPPPPAPSAATRLVVDAPTRLVGAQPTISPAPAEQPSPSLPLGQPEAKPLPKTPGLRRHLGLVGASLGALLLLGIILFWRSTPSPSPVPAAKLTGTRATIDASTAVAGRLTPSLGTAKPPVAKLKVTATSSASPASVPVGKPVPKSPSGEMTASRLATMPVATLAAQGHAFFKQKQYKRALPLLQSAANRGSAPAQNELGDLYYITLFEKRDFKQALYWYRKAADQGYAEAQYNLGQMYSDGWGVERDQEQANPWFRKAADQEYARAQYMLGDQYRQGGGVDKNPKQAEFWYSKAANNGDITAAYYLARIYEYGWGPELPQNKTDAVYWYKKIVEKSGKKDAFYKDYAKEHLAKLDK